MIGILKRHFEVYDKGTGEFIPKFRQLFTLEKGKCHWGKKRIWKSAYHNYEKR